MDKFFYLNEGHLTKVTPTLVDISKNIEGKGRELLENIFRTVNENMGTYFETFFSKEEIIDKLNEEHMKRTADDVVKSGYHYGCDEYGIVFAVLARIKGIPTKYIQCSDIVSYTITDGKEDINGHVFLECYIGEKIYLINSTKGTIIELNKEEDKQQLYLVNKPNKKKIFVEAYSGLDSWEAGIRSHQEMVSALIRTREDYLK